MKNKITIPLTVPKNKQQIYKENYLKATLNSQNLFLFAGDQKIEHLNKDFYGPDISEESSDPKHLFEIASKAKIGAFATQLGLITRYASDYPNINYIIKINSKTNIVPASQNDPKSFSLLKPKKVVEAIKESNLNAVGLGYTIYLGSEYEAEMFNEASKVIYYAHQNGLLAILWMYPRGEAVTNEQDADIIAGAAGVGACLGADFVKINVPKNKTGELDPNLLKQAVLAAGRTKVICSGGKKIKEEDFLKQVSEQINIGGTNGVAVGRNIHQKSLTEAISFCQKLSEIIIK
ncbi:hypothetical protein KAW80_03460 [Candidatus Babeliales bacterium]|nr:hypothetical protein [Candidatus Babeliales bacterium]